jgi:hypothetical protein
MTMSSETNKYENDGLCKMSAEYGRQPLTRKQMVDIYTASPFLMLPWSSVVALVTLTGEPLDVVLAIRDSDIDWSKRKWTINRPTKSKQNKHARTAFLLTAEMVDALMPFEGKTGYLFRSPQAIEPPATIPDDTMQDLRTLSGVPGSWTMRDVHRATRTRLRRQSWWSIFKYELAAAA